MPARRPLHVLLVEDSPVDVEIALEAFSTGRYPARVTVVTDGQEAIDHLRSLGEGAGANRPDLVLLDWRLPRISGRQVLDFIRSEPRLRSMPVVVLSSSTDEADVTDSYESCANCWVSKPLDMDEYIRAVQSISGFWSSVARPPRG